MSVRAVALHTAIAVIGVCHLSIKIAVPSISRHITRGHGRVDVLGRNLIFAHWVHKQYCVPTCLPAYLGMHG